MEVHVDQELLDATYKSVPKFNVDGIKQAKCVSIYDGDTATFAMRLYEGSPIFRFSCRFLGYNSAEIHGKTPEEKAKAQESKKALSDMILDKVVTLNINSLDKYGRPLVTVTTDSGVNVNEWMLANGHGKPYTGEGEKAW
jgi:micrococcal nuclease